MDGEGSNGAEAKKDATNASFYKPGSNRETQFFFSLSPARVTLFHLQ